MNAGPDTVRGITRRADNRPSLPATCRTQVRSMTMNGFVHEEIARQRYREAYLQARRLRLARAVSAERRARRAVEVAVRAGERAGVELGLLGPTSGS